MIDTYEATFQHRPGQKHGNADVLSRYPCRQCGGEYDGTPTQGVKVVPRSRVHKPGWSPEDLSTEQDADPSCGGSGSGTTVPGGRTSHRSPETRRYYGVNGNGYFWYTGYYTDGSTNLRDKDGGTNWSFRKDNERTSSSACTEGRLGLTWGRLAPSLWWNNP